MGRKKVLAVLLSVVGAVAVTWPPGSVASTTPVTQPLGEPIFADEFTGAAGTAPDPAKWNLARHWAEDGLVSAYTSDPRNVTLDGSGNLVITARREQTSALCDGVPCEYTSAQVTTQNRFTGTYGRFEARIKVPPGQGLWSAFWAQGADIDTVGWPRSGEIDILEHIGSEPSRAHAGVHGPPLPGSGRVDSSDVRAAELPGGAPLAAGFHVYAVDWDADELRFSVDGNVVVVVTKADYGAGWVFDKPFFLILNLAVGAWAGTPGPATAFPAQLLVDYVRAYENPAPPPTAEPSPSSSPPVGTASPSASPTAGTASPSPSPTAGTPSPRTPTPTSPTEGPLPPAGPATPITAEPNYTG
ncbi:glycoside hydrolase family 16 protein [Frankia sp. CNm7]|uniref:Glycoside hydrolase family 16 protein n=1 Tax=Frankia nepalensis TaxID=1836974 RepID=A0A937RWI5_9ACTN|nr:glycoside hydrolase family 16 protein [Frankia nepalensis]MBL7498102.1 glycoside hydrolase family 16 protein [Frankia nepalensis]MBL7509282.1 glycoside hydrolase family 16 protein [Frankia nepalensis]MBL7524487.1 glycoside hydrolase family 16 protein [Frankia nepalensis]MBL7633131.1 glycoside hydrolase family 16 protein [Frankia nepalensis]